MRFPHQSKVFRGQLDAAPFMGVFFLFVLLVVLRTSLVYTPGVEIQLPEAANLPGAEHPTLPVALDATGQLYFENQLIGEDALKERLRANVAAAGQPLTLVILADRNARYEAVTRLGLLAREVGIRHALLGTREPLVPAVAK